MGRTLSNEVVERISTVTRSRLEAEGRAALSVRTIATAAGVSRQTVLNRFESMAGLLDFVACQGFSELRRHLFGARTMDVLLDRYRRWATANPELYRLMLDASDAGGSTSSARRSLAADTFGDLLDDDRFLRTVGLVQLELSGLDVVTPLPEER